MLAVWLFNSLKTRTIRRTQFFFFLLSFGYIMPLLMIYSLFFFFLLLFSLFFPCWAIVLLVLSSFVMVYLLIIWLFSYTLEMVKYCLDDNMYTCIYTTRMKWEHIMIWYMYLVQHSYIQRSTISIDARITRIVCACVFFLYFFFRSHEV